MPTRPVAQDGDTISYGMTAPTAMRASRPWTEAEMAAAIPYPLPTLNAQPAQRQVMAADADANKTPMLMPGGMPEGENGGLTALGLEMFSFASPTGYTYPAPFTRWTNNNFMAYAKSFPEKAIGKLYLYQRGIAYVCSAASIGNYAIRTAGHCVHDGTGAWEGWSYNVVFKPGFPGKLKQLGQYTAADMWTWTSWYYASDFGADMGGIVLNTFKGRSVSSKVGYLGFAYNMGSQQHWIGIGYPAVYPFDGSRQVVCASSYAYSDTSFSPATMGVGCDQTGGTSGGPWILGYGTGNYVNGNMSYRYTSYPLEMFSPYFDDRAGTLYYDLITDYP
jgi:V8-like Glu-specific endopeptidase